MVLNELEADHQFVSAAKYFVTLRRMSRSSASTLLADSRALFRSRSAWFSAWGLGQALLGAQVGGGRAAVASGLLRGNSSFEAVLSHPGLQRAARDAQVLGGLGVSQIWVGLILVHGVGLELIGIGILRHG
ncbi:hypothetical protein GT020_17940 [Glutamicibacter soli]|uniref:Uncharacterized protein n=1 Tax=Glutamicibacter soli TaxID=453836 RepID=A0A6L9G9W5_9MICC|nr:hypothetical protein [Glutamicibacter soli]NAZ17918.1 hypothetical protein [Glutamicibacter soli]